MKYQQLENVESGWKWDYLIRKLNAGEDITRYIDSSQIENAVTNLRSLEHRPILVLSWIDEHMSQSLDNKLKQAIRAKRKRYFNAETQHTKKKSIDLDFQVWEKLSNYSSSLGCTLSETIEYLLSDRQF